MTVYETLVNGIPVEQHDAETPAIEHAKERELNGEQASVVMVEESGTYKSRTQVYPKRSETYA